MDAAVGGTKFKSFLTSSSFMPEGNPCLAHQCHVCCIETGMPLTNDDMKRIHKGTGLGLMQFADPDIVSGWFQLMNVDGKCVFLDESGMCSIYDIRPEGCHHYPFIYYEEEHRVMEDEDCPHADEFRRDNEIVKNVRALVHKLEEEGKNR